MSDARLLDEAVDKLLQQHLPEGAAGRASSAGREALSRALADSGIALALAPEDAGGLGASLGDASVIAWRWGYHAAPLPIVEMMLAALVRAHAGFGVSSLPAVLADSREFPLSRERQTGEAAAGLADFPCLPGGQELLAMGVDDAGGERLLAVSGDGWREFHSLAGEPCLRLTAGIARTTKDRPLPAGTIARIRLLGALLCASRMTGAMARVIELAIEHANTRTQFGRPIGKFQAVQHLLADAASEQVVTQAALDAAVIAFDVGAPCALPVLAAKAQAGRAATLVAAVAHQIFGAIGFTEEHVLGCYTKQLWDCRDRWGRQSECERELGRMAAADPRGLWSFLVEPEFQEGSNPS